MRPSRAIILAAGNGSRMGALTAERPKAMLDVAGTTLVDHQLEALAGCGIHDVTLVVGYRQDRLREHLGARARYIENARFRDTNSVYSLWLARDVLRRGAVVMNSDVLVSGALLRRLISAPGDDAALIDSSQQVFGDEEMKVTLWHNFIVDFGKDLPAASAHGENVGVLKFSREGGRRLAVHLDRLVDSGATNSWAPMAFRSLAREWPVAAVSTDGLPWTEIDFPSDLERARQLMSESVAVRRAA